MHSEDNPYAQHRLALFQNLKDICDAVDAHHWCLPTSAQSTFRHHVEAGLAHYSWLAKDAARNGRLQWSI
eukprot:3268352-Heterocapsa_arctica.AAC.1